MKIRNPFKTKASTNVKNESSSDRTDYLRGGSSSTVTSSNAQKIATVLSCVNIKANALVVIPIKTYKVSSDGKEQVKSHYVYNLLNKAPNKNLPVSLYKKMISQDLDLRGNHYSQIVRNGLGQIVALYPLVSDKMEVLFNKQNKIYKYDGKVVRNEQIMHVFDIPDTTGFKGISRIEYAKESLKFANSASEHGNKVFENAATPSGAFSHPGELSDEAYKRLKDGLDKKTTGVNNAAKTLLLEGGLTFTPMSITNSDAQWLESRKLNREEVCGIFGVPSSMINDTDNTAYGNLEAKYQEFYTGTVFPLITILEEIFWMSLLSESEKKDHEINFKYNTMLRVDTKTRAEYYKMRFGTGSITPNEIRKYEDENSVDGGDECYVQLNLSTVKNLNKGNTNENNN